MKRDRQTDRQTNDEQSDPYVASAKQGATKTISTVIVIKKKILAMGHFQPPPPDCS